MSQTAIQNQSAPASFRMKESAVSLHPLDSELAGRGLFSGARLVINTNNRQHAAQLRFSLTVDGNVLFYGMPGWFMSSKLQEKGDITVSIVEPDDPSDGNCSMVIDMVVPFMIRFHQHIRLSLTGCEDDLDAVCSAGWYISAYVKLTDPQPDTKPTVRLRNIPLAAS